MSFLKGNSVFNFNDQAQELNEEDTGTGCITRYL